MLHPTIFNTAHICHQLGVGHAVMSPGSRNAPLTISFARHQQIKKWIIPDERAAGFIALGIAQETKSPVVLCCTSGTALLNYAPAIAEAYYREIPLIVLSADRPPELIDQRDGQTIRQFEALRNHVKHSVQLPLIDSEKAAIEYSKELISSIHRGQLLPKGPIHINIPFKEPFYPQGNEELGYEDVTVPSAKSIPAEELNLDISQFKKALILVGQKDYDSELNSALEQLQNIPVLRFPLNNLQDGISHADLFVQQQEELRPDLLITSGLSVLSKKIKIFLRNFKPRKHIHFDPAGVAVDTFQTKPDIIRSSLNDFLKQTRITQPDSSYKSSWLKLEGKVSDAMKSYLSQADYSETVAASTIIESVPTDTVLHLSNSMPVRYADMVGVKRSVSCLSNRGTSGIDGCTSTAIGSSLVSDKLNILLTGDLAFLYDRNAFFHNYNVPNLRIVVLNNQGGGIFRLIDGPSNLPELEDYFETRHDRTAEYICAENDLSYFKADDLDALREQLKGFYQDSDRAKVLEVFTEPETNQRVYKELKEYINERIKN